MDLSGFWGRFLGGFWCFCVWFFVRCSDLFGHGRMVSKTAGHGRLPVVPSHLPRFVHPTLKRHLYVLHQRVPQGSFFRKLTVQRRVLIWFVDVCNSRLPQKASGCRLLPRPLKATLKARQRRKLQRFVLLAFGPQQCESEPLYNRLWAN
jgi:hypothetical protein